MMQWRSFTAFFFAAVILFNSIISAIYFLPIPKKIKKNLELAFADEKKLMNLSFSEDEFHNLKMIKKDEFSYNGELYDIKSQRIIEGRVVLLVYHDIVEKNLISNLSKIIGQTGDNSGKTLHSVVKIFDMFDDYIEIISFYSNFVFNLYFPSYSFSNIVFYPELLSPPPQA